MRLQKPLQIKFYPSQFNCLLEVDPRVVAFDVLEAKAKRNGLKPKSEFHLTVLGTKHSRKIKEIFIGDERLTKASRFLEKTIYEYDWKYKLLPEYYKISKVYRRKDPANEDIAVEERRESYIQLVSLSDLDNFFVRLNKKFGTDFEVPLPHITLYSKSTDPNKMLRGIGLYSARELEKCGERIQV